MPRCVAVSKCGGEGKFKRACKLRFNGSNYSTSGGVLLTARVGSCYICCTWMLGWCLSVMTS